MAKTYRKKFIAAKIETTKGTAQTLAAADAAILAFDPTIDQAIDFAERAPAGIAMGTLESVPGEYVGEAKIRVELKGSGTADALPVWASTLLVASGFAATTSAGVSSTLGLVSSISDQKTVTIAIWEDGMKKVISGAMCDFEVTGESGRVCYIEFTARGIWNTPIDEAAPSGITHEATLPLRTADATLTLGGDAFANIGRFSFRAGNDVQLRMDIAQASAVAHAYIADRRPMFSMDPEAVSVATDDLFGDMIAMKTGALVLELPKTASATAGNQWKISVPKLQRTNPRTANRNGLQTHEIEAIVVGGDDAYTMVHQ